MYCILYMLFRVSCFFGKVNKSNNLLIFHNYVTLLSLKLSLTQMFDFWKYYIHTDILQSHSRCVCAQTEPIGRRPTTHQGQIEMLPIAVKFNNAIVVTDNELGISIHTHTHRTRILFLYYTNLCILWKTI